MNGRLFAANIIIGSLHCADPRWPDMMSDTDVQRVHLLDLLSAIGRHLCQMVHSGFWSRLPKLRPQGDGARLIALIIAIFKNRKIENTTA